MTVRTAICVLVIMTAGAFGQDPLATINNTRNQLRSATNAVDQRRNQVMENGSSTVSMPEASVPKSQPRPFHQDIGFPSVSRKHTKAKVSGKLDTNEVKLADAAPEMQKALTMRGKRDPFVSVIRTQSLEGPACASGKKCLVVGKIALKGIVRSASGMIAVVENAERKTYFLHENDPVFNGQVVRIESDGIIFREKVVDRLGRQSMREVVKRISSKPAV